MGDTWISRPRLVSHQYEQCSTGALAIGLPCLEPTSFTSSSKFPNSALTAHKIGRVGCKCHSMAASFTLALPPSLNSIGCRLHHCRLGAAVRSSSSALGVKAEYSFGGVVTVSSRVSGYCGLKKMSSSEGLSQRVRDPQVETDGLSKRERDPQVGTGDPKTVEKSRNYVRSQISKPGVKSLVIAVGIPLLLGSVNAVFNSPFSKWFSDLKKPWWEPPGPIFGGAWSILYPLMGLASWLVWAEGGFHKQTGPLALYVTQLFLNLLWPKFFFGSKKLGLALVDILLLDGVLAATIRAFQPVNQVAANLLKPYLAWVIFATVLNFNLWLNNRGGAGHQGPNDFNNTVVVNRTVTI